MSNYPARPESPPTGFTVTGRPRSTSKEKKGEKKSEKKSIKGPTTTRPNLLVIPTTHVPVSQEIRDAEFEARHYATGSTPALGPLSSDMKHFKRYDSTDTISSRTGAVFVFPSPAPDSVSLTGQKQKHKFDRRVQSMKTKSSNQPTIVRSISFTGKQFASMNTTSMAGSTETLESHHYTRSVPDYVDYQNQVVMKPAYVPNLHSIIMDSEDEESYMSSGSGETEFSGEDSDRKRFHGSWRANFDFGTLVLCQAFGLSNIWRFPYFCYINGGGSFLLAYLLLVIGCGAPLLCMEYAIGQVTKGQPILAIQKLCPRMAGVGVSGVLMTFWQLAFYSVLISWSLFYFFNSLYSTPRWHKCHQSWNSALCREKPSLSSVHSLNRTNITTTTAATPLFLQSTTAATLTVKTTPYLVQTTKEPNITFHTPTEEFFNSKLLEVSKGIQDLGELRFELLAAILFAWVFIYVAVRKPGVLVGHSRYVLALLPLALFFILALRAGALDGARVGLGYFFQPRWDSLQDVKLWLYALAQTFHSLGVVFGFGISLGSIDNKYNNMIRDTIVTVLASLLTQVLVCCIVFAVIGHVAFIWNHPVETAVQHDPGLVFIAFSELIAIMPVPTIWSIVFFVVFFALAMDTQVTMMQMLVTTLKESFSTFIKTRFHGHAVFLLILCSSSLVCSVPYVTKAGIYFFQLSDHYVFVLGLCILAFFEFAVISWIYGSGKISYSIYEILRRKPPFIFTFSWYLLGPLTVIVILLAYFIVGSGVAIRSNYVFPSWAIGLGWIFILLALSFVPACAAVTYFNTAKAKFIVRLRNKLKGEVEPAVEEPQYSCWEPQPLILLKNQVSHPEGATREGHNGSPGFLAEARNNGDTGI